MFTANEVALAHQTMTKFSATRLLGIDYSETPRHRVTVRTDKGYCTYELRGGSGLPWELWVESNGSSRTAYRLDSSSYRDDLLSALLAVFGIETLD